MYVQRFATPSTLTFIGVWNIDKLFHIAGGIFIAIFFEWRMKSRLLLNLLVLVGCIATSWELFEIAFLPDVQFFYRHAFELWRLDTAGDITSAFLGAYSYWVLAFDRN